MPSIPASEIVNINANVIQTGGSLVDLNSVFITQNNILPRGVLQAFSTADDVADYFGASSQEYLMSVKYFAGYSISTTKPATLYFYRLDTSPTAAVFITGQITAPLSEFQASDETSIEITVDGTDYTVNLLGVPSATSYADVAADMEDNIYQGLTADPGAFSITYSSVLHAFVFTSPTTGTSSTITLGTSSFSSTRTRYKLLEADGAFVTSPGTNGEGSDFSTTMNSLHDISQDWFAFTTVFEPTLAQKKSLVDWVNPFNAEYAYICWDTSSTSVVVNEETDNLVNYVKAGAFDNTVIITKDPDSNEDISFLAAFLCGSVASVDFNATNNRPTFAFKQQSGLIPSVTSASMADAIITNGANFYGLYGTKNSRFQFLYPGQVSGQWRWFDELVNAAYMKAQMQNALMSLLVSIPSIPYNSYGYALIRTTLIPEINSFINYGAIRVGVTLSGSQVSTVNNATGRDVTNDIFNQGYVLDIKDPGATVRGERGSPIINLYYTSGGAVQKINMTATLLQ